METKLPAMQSVCVCGLKGILRQHKHVQAAHEAFILKTGDHTFHFQPHAACHPHPLPSKITGESLKPSNHLAA
eukprot:6036906-Amphidinium_carterae.1